jgi:hypothetical protein
MRYKILNFVLPLIICQSLFLSACSKEEFVKVETSAMQIPVFANQNEPSIIFPIFEGWVGKEPKVTPDYVLHLFYDKKYANLKYPPGSMVLGISTKALPTQIFPIKKVVNDTYNQNKKNLTVIESSKVEKLEEHGRVGYYFWIVTKNKSDKNLLDFTYHYETMIGDKSSGYRHVYINYIEQALNPDNVKTIKTTNYINAKMHSKYMKYSNPNNFKI